MKGTFNSSFIYLPASTCSGPSSQNSQGRTAKQTPQSSIRKTLNEYFNNLSLINSIQSAEHLHLHHDIEKNKSLKPYQLNNSFNKRVHYKLDHKTNLNLYCTPLVYLKKIQQVEKVEKLDLNELVKHRLQAGIALSHLRA